MQVTAVYQGNEIGFGEGQHYIYAIEECIDSIDSIYIDNALQDIELYFVGNTEGATLPKIANLTDYYYREREYF